MIRGNLLQKSEFAYSKAIGKAAALRSSQSMALYREHMRLMQELEEQALREESKSHQVTSFPPVKLPCIILCNPSGRIWLPPTMSYWGNHLHHLHLFCPPRHPFVEEQLPTASSPTPMPKWSPRPKRWIPLPEPQGSTSIDMGLSQRLHREDPLVPRSARGPCLVHIT